MENPEKSDAGQEYKGKNLEDAILHAEHKLKLTRAEFNYEVVTEKTRLFGISKEVVIRAWAKKAVEVSGIEGFLENLVKVFPLEIGYRIQRRNGFLFVVFDGPDKQLLLWKDGELLLALQHVLNKLSTEKVQVDCEFFRKRKEKKIHEYALQAAQHVRQSGRNEILELMNPYERRLVHIAVNQIPGITSESLGDGFLKRVKIFPVDRQGKRVPPKAGEEEDL
jgi:spoIIIJ-associated protein